MDKVVIAICIKPQNSSPKPQISYEEAMNRFNALDKNVSADEMRKMLKFLDTLRERKENQGQGIHTRIEEETESSNYADKLFE